MTSVTDTTVTGPPPPPPGGPTDGPPPPPIDPRIRQRRVAIRRDEGRRRLRAVAGVVAAVALVVAGWALLHTPPFSARVVTVTGSHPHTTTAAIVAAAGLEHAPPLVSVNTGAVAAKVETLPFIATAQVGRHWPDGLTIAVTERVPAVAMAGPRTAWTVLDGAGRALEVLPTQPAGVLVLVVHTAAGSLPPPGIGATLPSDARPGLVVGRSLPPAFSAQVVSVTTAPDGTMDLALNSGITVHLGTNSDLAAKYEDVAAIIAHGSLQGKTTIDVSVPQSPIVS